MYRLESVFRRRPDSSPLSEADLEVAPPHHIHGEIDNALFVSVSETVSHHACQTLRGMLDAALQSKKQVVILTHNIELLKATKLTASATAAILKAIGGKSNPECCELCGRPHVEEERRIVLPGESQ